MAEQQQPIFRKVALKVIKLGMDTRQVIARFEAERQALAMMDHPNIARVLDAGATESGRPYFVMELVRGVPITEYCDSNKLDTRARLELFTAVCRAVQHAHQKGIIHRDIKPSNVLVTLHDGQPVPKVIDFGIAKATSARLTDKTLFTEFRQFIGTPQYMSPEQAEMSGLDIDTRADVYALGVLLYELLTGTTPLDPRSFQQAAYAEMQRMIREVEPPRPSTRLSTMGGTATAVAASRSTDPKRLGDLIRGELDWIVMRCLEKDRTRRYETANALAADVQRHLNDEAVEASPPSATYKLRKLARRYRAQLRVAGGVALLLVVATVFSAWQAIRATRATKIVEAQVVELTAKEAELRQQRDEAVQANERAEKESRQKRHAMSERSVSLGLGRWEANQPIVAALWFARALALDAGNPERERLQRIRLNDSFGDVARLVSASLPSGARGSRLHSGRLLRVEGDDVLIEEVAAGSRLVVISLGMEARSAEFSPDGTRIATTSADGGVRFWDANGKEVGPAIPNAVDDTWGASFSPDGQSIVAFSTQAGRIFDARTSQPRTPVMECDPRSRIAFATFSPDGKDIALFAHLSSDVVMNVFDVKTGISRPYSWNGRASMFFGPKGLAIVGGEEAHSSITVVRDGILVHALDGLVGKLGLAVFSQNGETVWANARNVFGFEESGAWSVSTGKRIGKRSAFGDEWTWAALNADADKVVVATDDGIGRVFDIATGEAITPELRHEDAVRFAAFVENDRAVVTISRRGVVRAWDARGTNGSRLLKHGSLVTSAHFTADSKRLITTSMDGTARLWDMATGRPVLPPMVHRDGVEVGKVSPDGRYLLTISTMRRPLSESESLDSYGYFTWGRHVKGGGRDGIARVWELATGLPTSREIRHSVIFKEAGFDKSRPNTAVALGADDAMCSWDYLSGEDSAEGTEKFTDWDDEGLYSVSADGAREWIDKRVVDVATGRALSPSIDTHAAFISRSGAFVFGRYGTAHACVWDAVSGLPVIKGSELEWRSGHPALSPDESWYVLYHDGAAHAWPIGPIELSAEQCEWLAELLSSSRIDEVGGVATLTADEWRSRWERLSKARPQLFALPPVTLSDRTISPEYRKAVEAQVAAATTPEARRDLAQRFAVASSAELSSGDGVLEAILLAETAVRLDEASTEAHEALACAYLRSHRFDDALPIYQKHKDAAVPARPADNATVEALPFGQRSWRDLSMLREREGDRYPAMAKIEAVLQPTTRPVERPD